VGFRAVMHAVERAKSLPFPGNEPGLYVYLSKPRVFYKLCGTFLAPAHSIILTFRLYTNNAEEKVKR
jgi:hypothetical protein